MKISHREIYALVDINNCYVSCERLFNPKLIGLPVVVLSNNDGCVVSRSEEAKKMGIKMGIPWYQIEEAALQAGVHPLGMARADHGARPRARHAVLQLTIR